MPDIRSRAFTALDTASSWSINYPATISSGDDLILILAMDNAPTVGWTGWGSAVQSGTLGTAMTAQVFHTTATGSETGTLTVDNITGADAGYAIMLAIQDADSIVYQGTLGSGNSTNLAISSLDSGQASGDKFWLAWAATDNIDAMSTYPANLPDNNDQSPDSGAHGARVAIATATSSAQSLDPDDFVLSGAEQYVAGLIAFLPAASDSTAPTYSSAPAITAGPSTTGATVSSTASDETDSSVEKAYVVLAAGAAAPATGQDVFDQTGNAASPVASGSLTGGSAVNNGVVSNFAITGLTAATNYDYYEAIRDSAGNYALSSKVDLDTSANITLTVSDTTITPGQAVTLTTTNLGAITTATLQYGAETPVNVFSLLSSVVAGSATLTMSAASAFVASGLMESIKWNSDLTLLVGDGSDTVSTTVQVVPSDTDGPTDWFVVGAAAPYPGDTTFPTGSVAGDQHRYNVTQGTVTSIGTDGVLVASVVPLTFTRITYDDSANAWLAEDTYNISLPQTSVGADEMVVVTAVENGLVAVGTSVGADEVVALSVVDNGAVTVQTAIGADDVVVLSAVDNGGTTVTSATGYRPIHRQNYRVA